MSIEILKLSSLCNILDKAAANPALSKEEREAISCAETVVRNAWGLPPNKSEATCLELCNRIAELEDIEA
jgi:hypothetical protein